MRYGSGRDRGARIRPLLAPDGGGAAKRMEIPEVDVSGQAFDADLALHSAAVLAQPNDPELGFGTLVLQIEHAASFELSTNAVQRSSTAANDSQARGLSEGGGMH